MSTSNPTFNDIWQLFQETSRLIKESNQETDRKFQETDRKFQETDRKFQETERLIKDSNQETNRKIAQMSKELGKLGNRLGDFVEDAVRPAAVRLFQDRGINVHEVHRGISSQRGGEGIEVDLLVVDDTDLVAIECKSNLSIDDVNEHIERLQRLIRLLPAYTGKRVLGAVAGMVIPEHVASYAYRKGLFVIGQNGEQLVIRNSSEFIPKAW